MSANERPGVYTSYEVNSSLSAYGSGGAVGLAAAAASGTAGEVVTVTSHAEAVAAFGSGNMTELVKNLLKNGAPVVYAVRVVSSDYDTAFAALMGQTAIKYMLCDSHDATVHAKMKNAINGGGENSKYRIGIVESGSNTRAALISAAEAMNSERMVLVSHCETDGVSGSVAAAVCAAIAAESDPAVPVNGAVLRELGDIGANFSDADITLLVRGGVTVLETVGGEISVIRGVTTRTTTQGTADATWRELTTILIVDKVIPQIRDSLRAKFARAKNNAQTRGAIRTQVMIELEDKLDREYIDGYSNITVSADTADPTVCIVSFNFTVAHGLNRIELKANITV